MSRIIKNFTGGIILEYDKGVFDDWCVYLTRPGQLRYAPKDIEYFQTLKNLANKYTPKRIYDDFVKIYNQTNVQLNPVVLNNITEICSRYGTDALLLDIQFTIVYASMIAEENRVKTRLGKRVKRLGIHQCVMEGQSADYAANYSKGKPWKEIANECQKRGF